MLGSTNSRGVGSTRAFHRTLTLQPPVNSLPSALSLVSSCARACGWRPRYPLGCSGGARLGRRP